jgi:AcrR family transcriptional regulator
MPRVSVDHLQARRQQILDGSRAAFARHGYEGATVRILEQEIGLSRGAIFHHYADKDALFLALAVQDADTIVHTVAEHGLVQVMREMVGAPDPGRLGVQLEVARRVRTDAGFRAAWAPYSARIHQATLDRLDRLDRQRTTGSLRADVDVEQLAGYLELVWEGLIAHLAAGLPTDQLDDVLDVVEGAVRLR